MPLKVDYSETLNSIIDGLVRHNKSEIIGKMLTQRTISFYDLEDKNELERHVRLNVQQTAYQVLVQLKKQLGSELQIFEEDREVMTSVDE